MPCRVAAMEIAVNFTPTGMIPTKKTSPHTPVSVSEIVEDVLRGDRDRYHNGSSPCPR